VGGDAGGACYAPGMDIKKLKRVENLNPGDLVKAWGPDREVVSAMPNGTNVLVTYAEHIADGTALPSSVVSYGLGTVVETA